ncbi:flagellar hook-length control protein FliK [Pseudoalteromonas sp. McH1-7]|uniref:flagellar hook-length control protein FliK n=1 Tax=unclassified Pseudoalteromonas TaxID=194690 RepID=UPI001590CA15|nr:MULTISPECIES: flagellar hook-length control protein FliK [unclassified Pseudoalteromonas]NUZ09562.1 flagellar hook-length control protein FliK [Pseudoalteromonas sp. McH1-7]USD29647.1 flagellar hook-length control protein FliK [Pseudoalteromonas sp. SCSIO 43201]
MNVMLASMLQRGSQEVEVKGKASEQDANSQEGETGFRVLMAELTHQGDKSAQEQVDSDGSSDLGAGVTKELAESEQSVTPSVKEKGEEGAVLSQYQGDSIPSEMSGEVLPDLPDNDLYTQISASKKQDTSLQHPSLVAQSVKEALEKESNGISGAKSTEDTEVQGQKEQTKPVSAIDGTLISTGKEQRTDPKAQSMDKLPMQNQPEKHAEDQLEKPTVATAIATKGVESALQNNKADDADLGSKAAIGLKNSTDEAVLKVQSTQSTTSNDDLLADEKQSKAKLKESATESNATIAIDTKKSAAKGGEQQVQIIAKLTHQEQQQLKAVIDGKLDVYDASPGVQKAIAQLLGNRSGVTTLEQLKPLVQSLNSENMTSEGKTSVNDIVISETQLTKEKVITTPLKEGKDIPTSVKQNVDQNRENQKLQDVESSVLEKQNVEKQNTDKQVIEKLAEKELSRSAQVEAHSNKEALKSERQPFVATTQAALKQETSPVQTPQQDNSSLNQTLKEVQQVQQTQSSNQSTAQTKPATDANLQQAINIARQDAAKELHQRVGMMLNLNNKEAEIRLDPPELGAMQIRIKSDAEQAQVNIVVQNQQAKELLEQSMPRLREMLAEQGIELGDSQISHQQQGQSDGDAEGNSGSAGGQAGHGSSDDTAQNVQASPQRNTDSAIDYYA